MAHRAPLHVPGCAPFVPLAHVAQGEHADATQQNPSVQNPDVHCTPEEHAMPFGIFGLQTFVAQYPVAEQSPGAVQVVPQVVPLHTNGSHLADVGARHTPAPSHIRVDVAVPSRHVGAAQAVAAG